MGHKKTGKQGTGRPIGMPRGVWMGLHRPKVQSAPNAVTNHTEKAKRKRAKKREQRRLRRW